eukprot:CAMPEP_0170594324 /NCGR_PEP_ID=MMETSP0224-20130122/13936_1 /TAXON_ID=285029 /ORGANISM="Togula jolla, Strain CCCM 725" /LENGTH=268 /DNA_ID=CAMNT_0010918367 /DNA_START=58 /DNA_END=864 /DNA_ORIENTATION=-
MSRIVKTTVAASVGALLAASGTSFVVGRAPAARNAPEQLLRGASSQEAPGASAASGVAACGACLAVGVAVAAVAKRSVARRSYDVPFSSYEPLPKFANGLVGTEYAGWGTYEFDPLDLAARYPEQLPWFREAELKHGRVAMLAFLGLLVPDVFRLPLDVFNQDGLNNLTAHKMLTGPGLFEGPMWWLITIVGAIESLRFKQVGLNFGELTLDNAGDLGFGKGFLPKTPEGITQMKIKELKNGRLAMLAFSGAITQAALYDSPSFPFTQ